MQFYSQGLELNKQRQGYTVIIVGMGSANEKQRYNVTLSLIGWTHTHNIWSLGISFKKLNAVMLQLACITEKPLFSKSGTSEVFVT